MTEEVDTSLRDQLIRLLDRVKENTEKMRILKTNFEARKAQEVQFGTERLLLAGVVGRDEFNLLEARVAKLERRGRTT